MTITGDHAHIQSADPSWFSYQPSSSLEQAEARLGQVLEESESRDLTTFIEQLCWQTYTTAIRDVFAASDEEYSNAHAQGCTESASAVRVRAMVETRFSDPDVQPIQSIPVAHLQGIVAAREAVVIWARGVISI